MQSYQNQLDQTERHLEVQDVPKELIQRDMQVKREFVAKVVYQFCELAVLFPCQGRGK